MAAGREGTEGTPDGKGRRLGPLDRHKSHGHAQHAMGCQRRQNNRAPPGSSTRDSVTTQPLTPSMFEHNTRAYDQLPGCGAKQKHVVDMLVHGFFFPVFLA